MNDIPDIDWTIEDLAKYPFLEESKEYITQNGPSIEELIENRLWSMSRKRGKDRVLQSLENSRVSIRDLEDEIEQEEELFSYPIARMLVSSLGDNFLQKRYVLGEAQRIEEELFREEQTKLMALTQKLDLEVNKNDEKFEIYFVDYLENTERLRSPRWKLVNQDLREGYIYITKRRLIRIIKEKIQEVISDGLPAPTSDLILEKFSKELKEIESKLEDIREDVQEVDMGEVETDLFPPCIKKFLAGQKEGENLSHEARFAMTAFLKTVGLSEDEIVSIFQEAPDFDLELASYQIKHIIGEISGTEYKPPGCGTMKTNGICYNPDELCEREWMTHPLTYYSAKKKNKNGDE